ncbi:conserved hypothetical protein [Thermotomaculum hydrothermale]|uniref:ACB domain-containing protein n=1 Tax=Thermotomaculum hydrothermale TaxID=981385 RepID=A0A7R6PDF8_9BACT|nr:acyl-CoA-binding protein [Thermotomaculum hydrothermale]BBB31713.1 conserved hypothetical protein [Thermotomaculum hydrothermale]
MEELKKQFEEAKKKVFNLKQKPDNDTLLKLYALYKQATEGDISGEKPSIWAMKEYAKFEAWEKLKGISKKEAMQKYISLVEETIKKFGGKP